MRVKGCHERLEVILDAGAKLAGEQQPTMGRDPFGGGLGGNRSREREDEEDTRSRGGGGKGLR